MSRKALGLDIGISSVGWSVIDLDNGQIIDKGVRLFEEGTAAENLKRRTSRGGRRLKSRRVNRIKDARQILIDNNIIDDTFKSLSNPYELRTKGLTQELTREELATSILHLVKRRGSSLESVEDDESKANEDETTKNILKENDHLIHEGKYPCEIQLNRLATERTLRGVKNNFRTKNYVSELTKILSNQRIDEELKEKLISLIQRRRMYYEGPGSMQSPSMYGRFILQPNGEIKVVDLIEKMRGKCSVYPDQLRAPKMAPTSDLFNLLNDLNNLTINENKISEIDKRIIIDKFIMHDRFKITPTQLAKHLGVPIEDIRGFRVDTKDKPFLTSFEGLNKLMNVLKESDNAEHFTSDFYLLDCISEILTRTKEIAERQKLIAQIDHPLLSKQDIINLSTVKGIAQYHSISLKAMNEMIEDLIVTNDNQMQILARRHLIKNKQESFKGLKKIPVDNEAILSPVAKKSQQETLKIVNAARKMFGEFDSIVVEMPRDKNTDEQKSRIKKEQSRFEDQKAEVIELAKTDKLSVKTKMKIRLYKEQDGKCLYTGTPLNLNLIISDSTAYEIDHIIPISISFDDSMQNQVLVLHAANQNKGNLSPVMAFNSNRFKGWDFKTYDSYVTTLVRNHKISAKKAYYLLFEKDITKFDVLKEFVSRNLVDTRYASKVVLNTLQGYFDANNIPTKVTTIRGAVTAAFRKKISLEKNREENHYHHAVDATIIAYLSKQNYLHDVFSKLSLKDDILQMNENGKQGAFISEDEYFDSRYIQNLAQIKKIKQVNISYKVDRKPNRQISDETIYSTRVVDDKIKVVKKYKDIYAPKFTQVAEKIATNKAENLLIYHNDYQSYLKLKAIVDDYLHNIGPIEKENPFQLYFENNGYITKYAKKDDGPPIISLRYYDGELGNHIDVTHNYDSLEDPSKQKKVVLLQISPYRTDFYKNPDGMYKFVTVRYSNIKYFDKVGKYVIDKDWYENEKKKKNISLEAIFCFSMNRNEYIGIEKKLKDNSNLSETNLYRFIATNNDTKNVIEVKPIHYYEKKRIMLTIGGEVIGLRKFNVDVLGKLHEVHKEELLLEI